MLYSIRLISAVRRIVSPHTLKVPCFSNLGKITDLRRRRQVRRPSASVRRAEERDPFFRISTVPQDHRQPSKKTITDRSLRGPKKPTVFRCANEAVNPEQQTAWILGVRQSATRRNSIPLLWELSKKGVQSETKMLMQTQTCNNPAFQSLRQVLTSSSRLTAWGPASRSTALETMDSAAFR